MHASSTEPHRLFILEEVTVEPKTCCQTCTPPYADERSSEIVSPWRLALALLWAHLFQVTFDLTKVLDLGLQGFNLKRHAKNSHYTKLTICEIGFYKERVTRNIMWMYFMLNVQFVIFPRLKRLVETSVAFHRVVHKNGASSQDKNKVNERACSPLLFKTLRCGQVCRAAPVCDFKGSGRCESVVGGGGSGCDPHTTELFIVVFIPVSVPAAVAGAQGLIALLKVYSIQVSAQLE